MGVNAGKRTVPDAQISDLRCKAEDKQATLGRQVHCAKEANYGCQDQLRHTLSCYLLPHGCGPFHPSTYPICPQQKTELSVWGLESSLHIINCNNWQVGHRLLAFNPPGAHEETNKKTLDAPQLIFIAWAQRRFSLS